LSGPRNSCSRSATCQSESPVEAAKLAGYPQGSQFAASARKRARRKDVKATVAELQKPAKEKLAKTIEANFEWATKQLLEVGNLPIGISNARASEIFDFDSSFRPPRAIRRIQFL
jgi:hypothetical protein